LPEKRQSCRARYPVSAGGASGSVLTFFGFVLAKKVRTDPDAPAVTDPSHYRARINSLAFFGLLWHFYTGIMKTIPAVFVAAFFFISTTFMVAAEDTPKATSQAKPEATKKSVPAVVSALPATNFTVICYLEKHDCTITVKAGPKGTVYSAKKADGKVLCENASLEQLRAQAPELHEFIKSAVAANSGKNSDARVRARLDASMR